MDLQTALLDHTTNLCLSGGADGADLQFGMCAGKAGHSVVHWSFSGAKSKAPSAEIVILNQEQLNEADPFCLKASKTLKRYFPPKSQYVGNLLRRNWYQVANSGSCYAVSSLDNYGLVEGGTAWATTMFIDKHDANACPCYLFDQKMGYWLEWSDNGWQRIYTPPAPQGIWAGVGSRALNDVGKLAIRVLLGYQSQKPQ